MEIIVIDVTEITLIKNFTDCFLDEQESVSKTLGEKKKKVNFPGLFILVNGES